MVPSSLPPTAGINIILIKFPPTWFPEQYPPGSFCDLPHDNPAGEVRWVGWVGFDNKGCHQQQLRCGNCSPVDGRRASSRVFELDGFSHARSRPPATVASLLVTNDFFSNTGREKEEETKTLFETHSLNLFLLSTRGCNAKSWFLEKYKLWAGTFSSPSLRRRASSSPPQPVKVMQLRIMKI